MPVYIALLRGINIGPHKRIKMEKLRAACECAGFTSVKTYIQSGNVVLSSKLSPSSLVKKMQQAILNDFGFAVEVVARSREEMEGIIDSNPLLKERGVDPEKLHVVFLNDAPTGPALQRFEQLTLAPDRARNLDREIYFYFPNGVSGSSLWKHPLDRVLAQPATMRNWRTVNALYEMAAELK